MPVHNVDKAIDSPPSPTAVKSSQPPSPCLFASLLVTCLPGLILLTVRQYASDR